MYVSYIECGWCAHTYFPALAWKHQCPSCASVPEYPHVISVVSVTQAQQNTLEDTQYLEFLKNEGKIRRMDVLFNQLLSLEAP